MKVYVRNIFMLPEPFNLIIMSVTVQYELGRRSLGLACKHIFPKIESPKAAIAEVSALCTASLSHDLYRDGFPKLGNYSPFGTPRAKVQARSRHMPPFFAVPINIYEFFKLKTMQRWGSPACSFDPLCFVHRSLSVDWPTETGGILRCD